MQADIWPELQPLLQDKMSHMPWCTWVLHLSMRVDYFFIKITWKYICWCHLPICQFLCRTGPFFHCQSYFLLCHIWQNSFCCKTIDHLHNHSLKVLLQGLQSDTLTGTIVFRSGQDLIFTCIGETRLFVYRNNIGNTFVEVISHCISSSAELVPFSVSKLLAALSYLAKFLLLGDNRPLT